jgi:hypothetical protein
MKFKQILLGCAVVVGLAPAAFAADHFECYQAKDVNKSFAKGTTANVSNAQSNGSSTITLKKIKTFCVPASVNGSSINDTAAHLTCIQGKDKTFPGANVMVTSTALGMAAAPVELKGPKFLCVDSIKSVVP